MVQPEKDLIYPFAPAASIPPTAAASIPRPLPPLRFLPCRFDPSLRFVIFLLKTLITKESTCETPSLHNAAWRRRGRWFCRALRTPAPDFARRRWILGPFPPPWAANKWDFETVSASGFMSAVVGEGITSIPGWTINGTLELISSGQQQGDMILIVPQGKVENVNKVQTLLFSTTLPG
uniref:DUF642 domain-containing protein n=1 Tax=Ananas comosus var. bracteatus TaxID=296719 RepID=A0A6V7PUH8_ANACO|nr:unnamed protein product [Ananas comosus var. bracteatus]